MTAYYNENNKFAAKWIHNLITAGCVAPGVVDTRSIEDVTPNDLAGFTQCHFFAGVAIWSAALRLAGWPDDRAVWTASCPCQPFSEAGEGVGFADQRHLWPALYHLVRIRKPVILLGEQVAKSRAYPWFDLVQSDMGALGYPFGCVPFTSAGVGAPHIRERAYWVALTPGQQREGPTERAEQARRILFGNGGQPGSVEHARFDHGLFQNEAPSFDRSAADRSTNQPGGPNGPLLPLPPGPVNGPWRNADWLHGTDGDWRPVEPGTFPLVDGYPGRVGEVRAYGNAINRRAASVFIQTVMEYLQ